MNKDKIKFKSDLVAPSGHWQFEYDSHASWQWKDSCDLSELWLCGRTVMKDLPWGARQLLPPDQTRSPGPASGWSKGPKWQSLSHCPSPASLGLTPSQISEQPSGPHQFEPKTECSGQGPGQGRGSAMVRVKYCDRPAWATCDMWWRPDHWITGRHTSTLLAVKAGKCHVTVWIGWHYFDFICT